MYPAEFDYYRPKTLAEAVTLLRKHKGAKLLAGGHSLLPMMKLRTSTPPALIDIGRVRGLGAIKAGKTAVKIGAMVTHDAIVTSEALAEACPILVEAATQVGDQQVRYRGTIGGSLVHADPAADYPTVITALRATLSAAGSRGDRDIPAEKFFTDLFTTALRPNEILTTITVPAYGNNKNVGGAYLKHRHPASSFAVVGVAALVEVKNGMCAKVDLVVGGVTTNPVRITAAEQALMGQAPEEANFAAAAEKVPEALEDPLGDIYASGEYRIHLAKVMARRALLRAAQRAMG
jgi:carbon-monoxide dehydrogenase medium subunit